MEQPQKANLKLVAFAAVVLLCAGVPHFLFDRTRPKISVGNYLPETLLPPTIGTFHVVSRKQVGGAGEVIEHVAIYQDPTGRQTAQFDLRINSASHNGVACYLARGMPVQWRRIEQLQSADSTAGFEIASIADQSLRGAAGSVLFIASTECMAEGCREIPLEIRTGPQLIWLRNNLETRSATPGKMPVPLSITFQSIGKDGNVQDQEQALSDFRKLVANFNLNPLREVSAAH
jgi:hypothetical protein